MLARFAWVRPLAAQARPAAPGVEALQYRVDSLLAVAKRAPNTVPAGVMAAAYLQLASAHEDSRHQLEALEAYRAALGYADTAHDSTAMATAQSGLGLSLWRRNQYDSALVHMEHARALRVARGDRAGLGVVLNSIGATYYQLGNYEHALDAFVQSLALKRDAGDSAGAARLLVNIGKTYHDWHQYERARRMLEQAAATAVAVDSQGILGYALNSLAMLQIDAGEYAQARTSIAKSEAAYRAQRSPVSAADSASAWSLSTAALSLLFIREGKPAQALPLLDTLLAIGTRRNSIRGQARSLLYLGEAYRALGKQGRARDVFARSLVLSRSIQQRVLTLDALRQLAELEEAAGNAGPALRHVRAYQALRDTIFDQSAAQRIAAMEARAETERAQRENNRLRQAQRDQTETIARQRIVVGFVMVILLLTAALVWVLVLFNRKLRARSRALRQANTDLGTTNAELRTALSEVQTLSGLIPICASCKKVRDDQGYWEAVETYITNHSNVKFSHAICATCGPKLYGEDWVTVEHAIRHGDADHAPADRRG